MLASVPEHYRLIELALAGETEALPALLRSHIRSWEPIFVDALMRSKEHAREPLRQARG